MAIGYIHECSPFSQEGLIILSINGYDREIGLGRREPRGQEPNLGSQSLLLLDMFLQQQYLREIRGLQFQRRKKVSPG